MSSSTTANATAIPANSSSGNTTPVNNASRSYSQQSDTSIPKEPGNLEAALTHKTSPAPRLAEPKITFLQLCRYCFPAIGGLLFGYDSGYINGVMGMKEFKLVFGTEGSTDGEAFQEHNLESWQRSLVVSILSAGTFFGSLASGWVSDKIGRKWTIVSGYFVYMVGVILQEAASSVGLFSAGRAVAGLGVGLVSAQVITYVSETAPKKIRGSILSGYQFAITVGLLIANCVDKGTEDRMDSGAYRIPIGLQFAFALILILGLVALMPESPRWFIRKGNQAKAAEAIGKLRSLRPDSDFVQQELTELSNNYNEEFGKGGGKWLDCFKGGWTPGSNLRKVLLGMTLQMMQQLTGINFIFYFGTTFFKHAGIGDPFTISIITTVVNVCSTPLSFYLIERLGRRPLLIWGAAGMAVSQFIIAIVGTTAGNSQSSAQVVLIVFVCINIAFFAVTWGPTCWAVCGELYPLTIRSNAIALATASNWLFNFIIAFITPYLVDPEKANLESKVFFIWGSCCILNGLFAYYCVPETKGLKLEEIEPMMTECSPRKSSKWKSGEAMARSVLENDVEMGWLRRRFYSAHEAVGGVEASN